MRSTRNTPWSAVRSIQSLHRSRRPAQAHDSRRGHARARAVRLRGPAAVAPVGSLSVYEVRNLFQLLHLVNKGDIAGLEAFVKEHAEVLSEFELSETTMLRQCRMLAFTKLCNGKQLMTYEEIAKHLHVPENEAERCVVDVVKNGLVEGKMDQLKGEFVVS